jgi:peptide/nickel transport system substrate-binding protein
VHDLNLLAALGIRLVLVHGARPQIEAELKAKELLASSGFRLNGEKLVDRNGNRVRFSLNTNAGNTLRNAECSLMVSDLAKIGMQVDYLPLEFNSFVARIQESFDFDAILMGFSHDDTDPSSGINVFPSNASLHFWWPEQEYPHTEWEKEIEECLEGQGRALDKEEATRVSTATRTTSAWTRRTS